MIDPEPTPRYSTIYAPWICIECAGVYESLDEPARTEGVGPDLRPLLCTCRKCLDGRSLDPAEEC